MTENRKIASWTEHPYTAHDKRHITVEHRVVADCYTAGRRLEGVDIRHEIRCPERGKDEWTGIEVWEIRKYAVEKFSAGDWKAIP